MTNEHIENPPTEKYYICPNHGIKDCPCDTKYSPPDTVEKWEKEFDEKYSNEWQPGHKHNEKCEFECCLRNEIKSFISQDLHAQAEEIIKYIENLIDQNDDGMWAGRETADKIVKHLKETYIKK